MPSQLFTLINIALVFALSAVIGSHVVRAQDETVSEQESESDEVLLNKAKEDMRYMRLDFDYAFKSERRLKELLRRYPNSPLRHQAEEALDTVNETLGELNLTIALFYLKKFEEGKSKSPKGSEARLRDIVCKYPRFSKMDEVLLSLVRVYSVSEDGTEAKQFLQKFIDKHPRDRDFKKACEELKRL